MSRHLETRGKLEKVASVKTFNDILENCVLSDEEKYIVKMHYFQKRTFISLAMELNYSESAIKKKHKAILKKIAEIL